MSRLIKQMVDQLQRTIGCRDLGYQLDVDYPEFRGSRLNRLASEFGTDKGGYSPAEKPYPWESHTYADVYELLFGMGRHTVRRVLECGLGSNSPGAPSGMGERGKPGASLRLWRDFFPRAEIIGVDIDEAIIFQEERIRTYVCDQTDRDSIAGFVARAGLEAGSIDVIIDDGLHTAKAAISFFEGACSLLATDGWYVIEDVRTIDVQCLKQYFGLRKDEYCMRVIGCRRRGRRVGSSRLLVISRAFAGAE